MNENQCHSSVEIMNMLCSHGAYYKPNVSQIAYGIMINEWKLNWHRENAIHFRLNLHLGDLLVSEYRSIQSASLRCSREHNVLNLH